MGWRSTCTCLESGCAADYAAVKLVLLLTARAAKLACLDWSQVLLGVMHPPRIGRKERRVQLAGMLHSRLCMFSSPLEQCCAGACLSVLASLCGNILRANMSSHMKAGVTYASYKGSKETVT